MVLGILVIQMGNMEKWILHSHSRQNSISGELKTQMLNTKFKTFWKNIFKIYMTSEKDVLKQAKTVKERTIKSNDRAKRWNTVLLIKLNINLSLCSSNSTLRYLPERNENIRPQKDRYRNVYSHFIHSSTKLKQPWCPSAGERINML